MSKSLYCTACPPLCPGESETQSAGLLQCYGPGLGGRRGWGESTEGGKGGGGCGALSCEVGKISDNQGT